MAHRLQDHPDFSKLSIQLGVFAASLANTGEQMDAVQRLRAQRFRSEGALGDLDRFDPVCHHLTIRIPPDPAPIGAARFRLLVEPDEIEACYSAQFYDLAALARTGRRLVEVGRICIDENYAHDIDVARTMIAALTHITSACRADMLMGCASFPKAEPARHADALRFLFNRHLGPEALRPARRAGMKHVSAMDGLSPQQTDLRQVPALLRLYLRLGGWVSDHAVCDHNLDTVHVFTAVEVNSIPSGRLRALRALAQKQGAGSALET